MLRPSKHAHPDRTVIAASTFLLRKLRLNRVVAFDDLKAALEQKTGSSDFLFMPAVALLHLLGLLEYRPTTDSFEYVGD